ncbi:hypothetical protein [Actinokineospora sp. NPDC004072]
MSDTDLGLAALRLGEKIVEMYLAAGLGPVGTFGPDHDRTLVDSVVLDAADFAALDPQKIIDEADRMLAVWRSLAANDQADADLAQAATWLATNWTGEAADRFHDQMVFIEKFLVGHAAFVERALLALGMMLAVAVRARRNYLELAEGAVRACEQEMAAQEVRTAEADTKRVSTLVNGVIDLFGNNPAALAKSGIQTAVSVVAAELEINLKQSGAPQVVEGYLAGRQALREDFAEALGQIEGWVRREAGSMVETPVALLEPLPASYRPSSPDFRYEVFASGYRPVERFGPLVEQAQAPNPHSVVSRRLGAV